MRSPLNTADIAITEEIINKWQGIVNTTAEVMNVPAALIMRVEPPFIEVFRSSESPNNPYNAGSKEHLAGLYCEAVITTKDSLLVPDALRDRKWNENPDVKLGMISYLGFPLLWPDGEVFGTICVLDSRENSYGKRYENLMMQFKEVVEAHLGLLYQAQLLEKGLEEHKRAEEALRESEAKYRKLVEDSGDGIAIVSEREVKFVNRRLSEMFGYQSETEMVGRTFTDFLSPEYRNIMLERGLAREIGSDVPDRYDFKGIRKDGTEFDAELSVSRIEYQGRVARQGVVRDITARKRAEDALKVSEERFRTLVSNVPIGLSMIAEDGTYEYVNPKFIEMFGYTLKDVPTGKKWFEKAYPDPAYRREALGQWVEDLTGTTAGETRPRTFRVTCNDGSEKEIFFRSVTLTDGRQLVTYENITQRKRAEEALRAAEEKYRVLVENANEAVIVAQDGMLKFVNPKTIEITGYSKEQLTSRPFVEFVHSDDQEMVFERHLRRLKGDKVPYVYPFRIIDKQSNIKWLEINAVLISWEGRPATLNFLSDITDRKRAEEARQREKQAVQRLAEEREAIAKIGRIIDSTLEIDKVYELFAEEVRKVIPFDRIAINIIHPETDTCAPTYMAGTEVEGRRAGVVIPLAGSLTGEVARKRSSLLLQPNDITEWAGRLPALLPALKAGHRSVLAVPLISKDQVFGTLHLLSLKPNAYREADVKLAESIGSQIAGAIANAELYQELKNQWSFSITLIDTMSEGMGVLNEKGQLEFANPRLFKLLGYSSEEMLGIHWTSFVHPDDHSIVRAQGASGKKGRSSTYECRLLRKDGTPIPVLISWALRFDDQGQYKGTVGIITDITERKQAEERLRKYEARYSHLLDHMPDGVALTRRKRIIKVNPPMADMFGFPSPEEMKGLDLQDLATPKSKKIMRQGSNLRALGQRGENRFEFQALCRDGRAFPAEVTLTVDRSEPLPFVLAIIRDLTEQKRYERQRKLLSDRIMTAQERERTLIARELHDELGQALTGIKMDMAWIKSHMKDSNEAVSDRLKALGELIDSTIESVGKMAADLRPSALDRLGLLAAIEWYGGEFERRTGIECIIESEASAFNLDNKTAINAYRIFQEALTNVARHAGASQVDMRIAEDQGYLTISIADNGKGISLQKLSGPVSLGIAGMRERAELLNGRLDIKSKKGTGTKVIAYLPLHSEGRRI